MMPRKPYCAKSYQQELDKLHFSFDGQAADATERPVHGSQVTEHREDWCKFYESIADDPSKSDEERARAQAGHDLHLAWLDYALDRIAQAQAAAIDQAMSTQVPQQVAGLGAQLIEGNQLDTSGST